VNAVPGKPEFDAIVAEAVRTTGATVAFISLTDGDGEKVISSRGWNIATVPPACAFAGRIRTERDVVLIPDTTRDPRFGSHPFVTGQPNIRFYAGVPLFDNGQFVGALSVVDRAPRHLATDQVAVLRMLGGQFSREMEMSRRIGELEERFREFFEQTDDLVMTIGSTGKLIHFNEAVLNTLGYPREALTGDALERFVDAEVRDEFRRALADVFEGGEPRVMETVFMTAAGHRIAVEGSLRPRVVDGVTVMLRVIFRDITERKQFEIDLGNARDSALEAARVKTQFLTNVSHEIRTPMNGIIGMLDLLQSTQMNEEQRDYAMQAKASADQLLAIVNNILYVSNVEAGGLGAANVDFDLYRTIHRIVEVMKVAALGKDIEISLQYDPGLPAVLRGQQARLRQIFTNLLDNAVKFTEAGTVSIHVKQENETETHRVVRFEIRDTGVGIAAEDRLLLFEKFSQVEAGSTRRYQGTGLGLATARHLVETLGGLIDVDSTPGQGSTFWFTIPFPKQASGRKPIASSDLEFRGKRVIVIDDLPTSRKSIRHYLEESWQMRVDVVETAFAALMMLRRDAADDPVRVVLYDAPADMDPFAFAREVRSDPRIASTGLVHLLGIGAQPNREAMRSAGIHAYVAKPVGQTDLFDALAVALAQDAIALARPASQMAERPRPRLVTGEMKKKIRVLLAEDNFLNAKLTMQQLEKLGYQAHSVGNGMEAVDAIEKGDYNVILMDCQMPVMDGYQATVEIRRLERQNGGRARRIIAMTANALQGDREKCLAAGMDDYLAKPTKHDDLEAALARYFG
jgi:two-component system, sensor histidine kinase and response regulator